MTSTITGNTPAPLCPHCHNSMVLYSDMICAESTTYWCHCQTPATWKTIHTRITMAPRKGQ